MLRQLLRPLTRNVRQQGSRAYHDATPYKRATMDEMPVPEGSWQKLYDSKQKIYNLQLAAGVTYLVGTITYIYATDAIFFNLMPPEREIQKK